MRTFISQVSDQITDIIVFTIYTTASQKLPKLVSETSTVSHSRKLFKPPDVIELQALTIVK